MEQRGSMLGRLEGGGEVFFFYDFSNTLRQYFSPGAISMSICMEQSIC